MKTTYKETIAYDINDIYPAVILTSKNIECIVLLFISI